MGAPWKGNRKMTEKAWTAVDFQLNKQLWNVWGHAASLPFRLENLTDAQVQLWTNLRVETSLYGTTLRHAINHGAFKADHDDDLVCSSDSIEKVKIWLRENVHNTGFSIIRDEPGLISIERHARYIDVRASPIPLTGFITSELHGRSLSVARNFTELLDDKYGLGRWGADNGPTKKTVSRSERVKALVRKGLRVPLSPRTATVPELRPLSEEDFLGLRIDDPDALNWDWRGSHLAPIIAPGETFGDALKRLSKTTEATLLSLVSEVDTSSPFIEPLNISRHFWRGGSNFFAYPFLYGFRHTVMPYSAANLYILSGLKPDLFTRRYFENLPLMTGEEIQSFLQENPIEVVDGSLTSGRHRAVAMLGRIWRGQGYKAVWARQT